MRPYDDTRYLQWQQEFSNLVAEFLETEGNDSEGLQEEFTQAVENAKTNIEGST